MPSKRFSLMRTELTRLQKAFIPRVRRGAVLDLTPRYSLRALAFRVLCHAEFEQYLEDRVLEIAHSAATAWKERRHVSETTLCLLTFSQITLKKLPETLSTPHNKNQKDWDAVIKPDERINTAISVFVRRIKQENHGIKEENILSMLLPIGFEADKIDNLLLANLNDFGTRRGAAAHASVAGHVTAGINPLDEVVQVKRILDGLLIIDSHLTGILQKCS